MIIKDFLWIIKIDSVFVIFLNAFCNITFVMYCVCNFKVNHGIYDYMKLWKLFQRYLLAPTKNYDQIRFGEKNLWTHSNFTPEI